jgi:tetratricopeptide (TPR) repeat protein
MEKLLFKAGFFMLILLHIIFSCRERNTIPSKNAISELNLKKGAVISCAKPGYRFGKVEFMISGNEKIRESFNLGIALLHSFEYDEAEKVFAGIIEKEPGCAMAYWGIAMCNYHPLWTPPSVPELKKGTKAIEIAGAIRSKTKLEAGYIGALASFYKDWEKVDHKTRSINFEKSMEKLYKTFENDKEAAVFYALALDAAADPSDKSFKNQKKAGAILDTLYLNNPEHPGIAHYIIHNYDYPELAASALPVARKYASIAPSSAHALHMPSHTFTMLGLWDESIQSNLASVEAAKCYAEESGIKGHWDEELHGMDYLVYAYLQTGENDLAKKQWDYLKTMDSVFPVNFKVAYAFTAIPSRFLFENRKWEEAAHLQIHPESFPRKNFPWQKANIHFTRLMGDVHTGKIPAARLELQQIHLLHDTLVAQQDNYKANQLQIQIKAAAAWIAYKEGNNQEALALMNEAAELEDKTEKHPVTPGPVIPARELLGDMLLLMNKPDRALDAYEANLKKHPNRFNGLYGAGLAAERSGDPEKAAGYYRQTVEVAGRSNSQRPELTAINRFLTQHTRL